LREVILNQYFSPDDRRIERELCELTRVSRTSVREALRQIESEGLIEMIPNRGPIVASLSHEDAQHIYEIREAMEGLAARQFISRADDTELDALVRAGESVVAAIGKRNVPTMLSALDNFNDTLSDGCANPASTPPHVKCLVTAGKPSCGPHPRIRYQPALLAVSVEGI